MLLFVLSIITVTPKKIARSSLHSERQHSYNCLKHNITLQSYQDQTRNLPCKQLSKRLAEAKQQVRRVGFIVRHALVLMECSGSSSSEAGGFKRNSGGGSTSPRPRKVPWVTSMGYHELPRCMLHHVTLQRPGRNSPLWFHEVL